MLKTSAGWCVTVGSCVDGSGSPAIVMSARPTAVAGAQNSSGSVPRCLSVANAILRVLGHCGTAVGFPIRPGGRSTVTLRMLPPSEANVPSSLAMRFISNAVQAS